jgi:hypothetical protein
MSETTLTPKQVRIAQDEANWLTAAATKAGVTHNDLLRLALHRLRKALGAASRDQARDRPGHRQGVQIQAHPAAHGGRHTAPGVQGTVTGVRKRQGAIGKGCPARSRQACSHRLSASSDPRRLPGATDGRVDDGERSSDSSRGAATRRGGFALFGGHLFAARDRGLTLGTCGHLADPPGGG